MRVPAWYLVLVCTAAGAATLGAQMPMTASAGNGSIGLAGEWQQAAAMPLNRSALHSASVVATYLKPEWAVDAGWLRVARDLSTVQGGMLAGGPVFQWRMVHILPTAGIFVGRAQASADTTGYDFQKSDGTIGHQPRYSYSEATSMGGGLSLALETPIYGPVNARVSVADWLFSGSPLAGNRQRAIVGLGLSVRVWQ